MMFENVESLNMNNKEVALIMLGDGKLYEKTHEEANQLIMTITGNSFSIDRDFSDYPIFDYTGTLSINWGDGNTETYTDEGLSHDYEDNLNTHIVTITGNITGIGNNCFRGCSNLTQIELPNTITLIGQGAFRECGLTSVSIPTNVVDGNMREDIFMDCRNLTRVYLNWTTYADIPYYSDENMWFYGVNSNFKIIIPQGTTSLYTSNGYPSRLLQEAS